MNRLEQLRRDVNLTRAELAAKSGLSMRVIEGYEQGHRNVDGMAIKRAAALAAVLGCKIEDLIASPE